MPPVALEEPSGQGGLSIATSCSSAGVKGLCVVIAIGVETLDSAFSIRVLRVAVVSEVRAALKARPVAELAEASEAETVGTTAEPEPETVGRTAETAERAAGSAETASETAVGIARELAGTAREAAGEMDGHASNSKHDNMGCNI